MPEYDFLIIGGGSGGIACARRAASHGARVAVFEPAPLGGTCVNVGCVPKKVMWYAAHISERIALARDYGIDVAGWKMDMAAFRRNRDAYIQRLNGIYARNLDTAGISHLPVRARLLDAATVEAGDQRYQAPHVLVATGGRPWLPAVPGAKLGINSDTVFDLEQVPARLAIIGAGYVAVEFAGVFNALGSQVSMLIRSSSLLRHFDAELGATLEECMGKDGIELLHNSRVSAIEARDGELVVHWQGGQQGRYDQVLWATGRSPNTQDLGLDAAGVALDPDGFIAVDAFQNTSASGVYAVGDVTGRAPLTPVAIAAGRQLAERLFGGRPEARIDYEQIPTVIFSHPPAGTVGLSEEQAREQFGAAVKVYRSRFTNMLFALGEYRPPTLVKLVTVGDEERVVGIHILGEAADEVIQGFAVALRMGARKCDLDRTMAIHPTAAEELVTLQ
ncbi:MAG: glutathione-disulfide reductase [Gammaproteobacteria bacterium]|nr:glutathione-disulfide reductase [Gammaproteobacteria bacterium]